MQIVINISDEDYEKIKKAYTAIFGDIYHIMRGAIANGTPLPKGHGRLIDADVLREEVYSWGMNDYEPSDFTDVIDDAPTIIEADEVDDEGSD